MKTIYIILFGLILSSTAISANDGISSKKSFHSLCYKKKYFDSGKLQSVRNKKTGEYVTYYENGNICEIGIWDKHRNIEKLTLYYSNGNLWRQLEFDANGKKNGIQKFYTMDGKLEMEGVWKNGKVLWKNRNQDGISELLIQK